MSDRSFEGGGFGNNVKLYKPWSMADGDEESRCLQHHLLFLIYDFGDILIHPECKKMNVRIHRESVMNLK